MKKLLKSTKFPPHFDTKVDMGKVQMDVMMPWVTQQVSLPGLILSNPTQSTVVNPPLPAILPSHPGDQLPWV